MQSDLTPSSEPSLRQEAEEPVRPPASGKRERERSAETDLADLQRQLDKLVAQLEVGVAKSDFTAFYDQLRTTEIPFIASIYERDPRALAHTCCGILHQLVSVSPAVALALENHLYVTSALATFPIQEPLLEERRWSILKRLKAERLLVANTDPRIHADTLGASGTLAQREREGFRVSGSAAYVSLATQGDLLVFLTDIENEGPAIFITPLCENPSLELGPPLFPRAMLDSDTRRIIFRDLWLSQEDLLLSGKNEQVTQLLRFQLAWHQLLIAALYLGAATRALEEVRLFLGKVHAPDGRPLAELDGMIADIGRLVIRYRTAWALVQQTSDALGELARRPLETAPLYDVFTFASTPKHVGTIYAEEVVTTARRIIGVRAFEGDHLLSVSLKR